MSGAARRRVGLAGGLALALAIAAIVGVALGRSAIAEINPVHFQDPAPPRAVQLELALPPQDSFAQAYGWDQGASARAADCGSDCQGRTAFRLTYEGAPPRADDDIALAELPPWRPGAVGDNPPEPDAQDPIGEKSAAVAPAAAPDPPEDDAPERD